MPLRDYELQDELAAGALGVTRRALRRSDGKRVVIKDLNLRGLSDWKPFERSEREARVLRALDHPGVATFVDAFEAEADDGHHFYIVSELVEGETLGQKISAGVRWAEDEARAVLEALLESLVYLHGLSPRVIHRDIKPGNVVVRPDGRPVLVDFGSVLDLSSRRPDGGPTIAGTAGYMAPEQVMGVADPRSDLYALGATMLHLLTHEHPTDLPKDGLRYDVDELVGLSPGLLAVVMRLVEPEASRRFNSAQEVLQALQNPPDDAVARRTPTDVKPATATTALARSEPKFAVPAGPRPIAPPMVAIVRGNRAALARSHGSFGSAALFGGVLGWLVGFILLSGAVGVALALMALSSVAIAHGLRDSSKERQRALALMATAPVVVGRVTYVDKTQLRYEFEVVGAKFWGSMFIDDVQGARKLTVGDPVHVLYDENKPLDHVPVLDFELARLRDAGWGTG